jgi:hypothetical protein
VSTPAAPEPSGPEKVLELIRSFAKDHPELVAEMVNAAEAAAPVPTTMYDVLHDVVGMIRGTDDTRREELHAAISTHQAEHEALVARAGGTDALTAQPDPETPAPPAPAPDPAPAPVQSPGPDPAQIPGA